MNWIDVEIDVVGGLSNIMSVVSGQRIISLKLNGSNTLKDERLRFSEMLDNSFPRHPGI